MAVATTFVTVPETAVYENHRAVFGQNYIGSARKFRHMDTKPQSVCKQKFSHHQFRPRILSFYRRHTAMPLLRCHNIRHVLITFPRTVLFHTSAPHTDFSRSTDTASHMRKYACRHNGNQFQSPPDCTDTACRVLSQQTNRAISSDNAPTRHAESLRYIFTSHSHPMCWCIYGLCVFKKMKIRVKIL